MMVVRRHPANSPQPTTDSEPLQELRPGTAAPPPSHLGPMVGTARTVPDAEHLFSLALTVGSQNNDHDSNCNGPVASDARP